MSSTDTISPVIFWLTVNHGCNFRCKWCYAEDYGYDLDENMPLETAKRIVDIAADLGVAQISLVGGEPTLWPGLTELNKYCHAKGIFTALITNAYRFSDDDFADEYAKNPCDEVNVSIKAVSPEGFERLVGSRALFEKAMYGVERALHIHGVSSASVVYNNLMSLQDLRDVAVAAHLLGVRNFTLSLCSATLSKGRASGGYMVRPDRLSLEIVEIYPFLNDLFEGRITLDLSMPLCIWPRQFVDTLCMKKQIETTCCVYDRSGLVFDVDASVLPCNGMVGVQIAQLGTDFCDADSLQSFLSGPDLADEYREITRYPSVVCDNCDLNDLCRGGCIINWTILRPAVCKAFRKEVSLDERVH